MTTEIEKVEPAEGHLGERMKYAQALASADLLPKAYQRKPANVLLAMEYGHALGLDTITAIQSVHVIEGKPTASAQLIGGLVRRAGHRLRVTGDDKHAVAEVIRSDDPEFVFRSEWTIARAQSAGLTGKGVWKQYPAAMLKARAITEVARDACPEALAGVAYTPEELGSNDSGAWTIEEPTQTAPAIESVEGEVVEAEVVELNSAPTLATEKQVKFLKQLIKQAGAVELETATAILRSYAGDMELTFETVTLDQAKVLIDKIKTEQDGPAA